MIDTISADELLNAPRIAREGSREFPDQLIAQVRERFPGRAYCIVEEWTVFRAALSQAELETIRNRGHLPLFLFAHKVIVDSQNRFQPGDWVRSSMCISFDDEVMFHTRNTVYVLVGAGHEQTASLKTIFSIF